MLGAQLAASTPRWVRKPNRVACVGKTGDEFAAPVIELELLDEQFDVRGQSAATLARSSESRSRRGEDPGAAVAHLGRCAHGQGGQVTIEVVAAAQR